jgi:hypothetical protein
MLRGASEATIGKTARRYGSYLGVMDSTERRFPLPSVRRRGRRAPKASFLTHVRHRQRDIVATQRAQRAAIPIYKCSLSYAITSLARPPNHVRAIAFRRAFALRMLCITRFRISHSYGRAISINYFN